MRLAGISAFGWENLEPNFSQFSCTVHVLSPGSPHPDSWEAQSKKNVLCAEVVGSRFLASCMCPQCCRWCCWGTMVVRDATERGNAMKQCQQMIERTPMQTN